MFISCDFVSVRTVQERSCRCRAAKARSPDSRFLDVRTPIPASFGGPRYARERRLVVNKIIPARPGRRAFQVLHSFEEGFVFPRVLAVKEHFDFERTSEINWLIGLKLTLGCRYLETIE